MAPNRLKQDLFGTRRKLCCFLNVPNLEKGFAQILKNLNGSNRLKQDLFGTRRESRYFPNV